MNEISELDVKIGMKHVLEKEGVYKGYTYYVVFHPRAYRCGYVLLPDEMAKDVQLDDWERFEHIECHIAINFVNFDYIKNTGKLMIGFSCDHICDAYDYETAKKYGLSVYKRQSIIEKKSFSDPQRELRTMEYVENWCIKIIDQLEEVNSVLGN